MPARPFHEPTLLKRLCLEHHEICLSYGVGLKPPVIALSDAENIWGDWTPSTRLLRLSSRLISQRPWWFVVAILKHEMAHQVCHEIFQTDDAHGAYFQMACELLGVPEAFRSAVCEVSDFDFNPLDTGVFASSEERDLLRRAEKLMALSESKNEHESLLAMQKLREIYASHHAELLRKKQVNRAPYVTLVVPLETASTHMNHKLISSILVSYFFVEVVIGNTYDLYRNLDLKTLEIMGTPVNVQMAEYVYGFLMGQCLLLWQDYQKRTGAKAGARRSFQMGLLKGFSDQLAQQNVCPAGGEHPLRPRAGGVPALVPIDPGLKRYVQSQFPHLRRVGAPSSGVHPDHYSQGHKEGQTLRLRKAFGNQAQNPSTPRALGVSK